MNSKELQQNSFKVNLWTLYSSSLHFDVLNGEKAKIQSFVKENSIFVNKLDKWSRTPIFYAVLQNQVDILEIFLKAGAKVDLKDFYGRLVLHYCAEKGYNSCLKVILQAIDKQKYFSKDYPEENYAHDFNGVTPLHLASIIPSPKCLQTLLKYSLFHFTGSVNSLDCYQRTPLHWAAAHGCDEQVALLIKHGSNCLLPDSNGKLGIHYAALTSVDSSKTCCQILLNSCNVNSQDFKGATPLHLAVASQMHEKVNFFLNKYKKLNVNLNVEDNHGRSPLHLACSRGSEMIAKLLLLFGADVNKKDVHENTPLHYAVLNDHKALIKTIIQNPSTIDLCNKKFESAMHWAAAVGANGSLITMIRHGGLITRYDGNGATPMHISAKNNCSSTVDCLLKLKVPVDINSSDRCTPLHYAAEGGSVKVVKQLLKANATLNAVDENGRTALHLSIIGGHLHLSQMLIESGICLEAKDLLGNTALHFAAYYGFTDLLVLLLENRANINASNNQGKVSLHIACQQGNYEIVKCLLEFCANLNVIDFTKERFSPLDYCQHSNRYNIATLLEKSGGVTSFAIFNFAALIIQVCWKGYRTRKILKISMNCDQMRKLLVNKVNMDNVNEYFQETLGKVVDDPNYMKTLAKEISDNLNNYSDNPTTDVEDIVYEDYQITSSSNSDDDPFDEVDLHTLHQHPIYIIEKEDGTIERELHFNGIVITLPNEEEQEQMRKAVSELQIVEVTSSEDES